MIISGQLQKALINLGIKNGDHIALGMSFGSIGMVSDDDLPPKKESSYNVSLEGRQRGDKWSERTSLRSRLSTS